MVNFPFVYCGILDGSGCGGVFYNVETSYVGTSVRCGYKVHVHKICEPFRCSNCGRLSEFVYTKIQDDPHNIVVDAYKELVEIMEGKQEERMR